MVFWLEIQVVFSHNCPSLLFLIFSLQSLVFQKRGFSLPTSASHVKRVFLFSFLPAILVCLSLLPLVLAPNTFFFFFFSAVLVFLHFLTLKQGFHFLCETLDL